MYYFDNNATTPCLPEVVEAMLPYFTEKFGQASSGLYPLSWQSSAAVEHARTSIANALDVESKEVIFTSGSTESCFLGIRGLIDLYRASRPEFVPHVISSELEHSAVSEVLKDLESRAQITVTWIGCDEHGVIALQDIMKARENNTVLIAIMLANNVTGVIQDITAITAWAKQEKIATFCDTTQAIGKIPVSLRLLGVDMATLSAHKMYGPKGTGILYLRQSRPAVRILPIIKGGGQESSIRGGTINVPLVVGFGAAALHIDELIEKYKLLRTLRDYLESALEELGGYIWGKGAERLPHVTMVGFENVNAVDIIHELKGQFAVSLGSACQGKLLKPSHVLDIMQKDSKYRDGSLRISLGIHNTKFEVEQLIDAIKNILIKEK